MLDLTRRRCISRIRLLRPRYDSSQFRYKFIRYQNDQWIEFSSESIGATTDFKALSAAFDALNHHLTLRSYLVGYSVKLADLAVWGALRGNPIFSKQVKSGAPLGEFLTRWYNHISSLEYVQVALEELEKARQDVNKSKKDQGSFDIGLKDAVPGQVVTRFPPEPSGYLHIGHAKAALLNDYFAKEYKGKLIVRFDDTNPSKEKEEFEESIKEDLKLIGIHGDVITHTSDHFETLYEYALKLINKGLAYADDTDQDTVGRLSYSSLRYSDHRCARNVWMVLNPRTETCRLPRLLVSSPKK